MIDLPLKTFLNTNGFGSIKIFIKMYDIIITNFLYTIKIKRIKINKKNFVLKLIKFCDIIYSYLNF